MDTPIVSHHDALIVVDVQRDFCPGGALPIVDGDEIVPVLNRWIDAAQRAGWAILASRDWHPPDHVSFRQRGGPWPVHCVQNTPGAEFHPALRLPASTRIVNKGQHRDRGSYSAFDGTALQPWLIRQGVPRLWIGGLALDVCVRATALDALAAGFEVHLIRSACRAIDPRRAADVFDELAAADALIDEGASHDVLGRE